MVPSARGARTPSPLRKLRTAGVATATSLLLLMGSPQAAQAVPEGAVSSATTPFAAPNNSTVLSGMAVTGYPETEFVQVTVSTDLGRLSLTETAGLTLAYGNFFTNQSAITFSGHPASINAGLASTKLIVGDAVGQKARVSIAALPEQVGFTYSPTNGHFYRYVQAPSVDWNSARSMASQSSFLGQVGYLATMPNQELNDLVASRIQGAANVWFGATAVETYHLPVKRTWQWADGPLAHEPISYCTNVEGECDFVNNEGLFSRWAQHEPNNADVAYEDPIFQEGPTEYTGEWVGVTNWDGTEGKWNDLPPNIGTRAQGYLVEYGNQRIGSTGFDGFLTDTSEISVAAVPEAPTDVTAIYEQGAAKISFTPGEANGSAIVDYTVSASPGSVSTTCLSSPCTVTGLAGGTYTFTVQARNGAGTSEASAPSNAVTTATAPGKPTAVTAAAGNKQAEVFFTAPAEDGGSAITGYLVKPDPGGVAQECETSPCQVTGLTNGTSYTFTVQAKNIAGTSPASDASNAVTPLSVPSAPTAVSAERGNASATVTFTAPSDNGGNPVTGYTVTSSPGQIEKSCEASPCTINGLANGTSYTFTVIATNAKGSSVASEPSNAVTPATSPGAPTDVEAKGGDASATIAFKPPAGNGGEPITGYTAYATTGNLSATCVQSPCVVDGLTNGQEYTFTVKATNAVGESVDSPPSNPVTPMTVPDAPTKVVASRGDTSASVTFDAPDDNGGSEVLGYVVTSSPGGHTSQDCSKSPCLVEGLENGTAYVFTVQAVNEVGASKDSLPSDAVTPATVPDAPTQLEVKRGAASAALSFIAPEEDGGSDITDYQVSTDGGETWTKLETSGTAPITATVTGLTNGTEYDIWVRARNEIGASEPASTEPVTPAAKPDAPEGVSASRGNGSASVIFDEAVDNGSPITGYTVTSSPDAVQSTCATSPCVVAGLDNGTAYTFTVVATNEVGTSPPSEPSDEVTPAAPPSAPTLEKVESLAGAVALTFGKPGDSGGLVITGYEVSLDDGQHWGPLTVDGDSPITAHVSKLTNGTTYTVAVRAVTDAGEGTPSESFEVTPATVPGSPIKVVASAELTTVTVTWKPPVFDGGSPIVAYEVTAKPGGAFCRTQVTTCSFKEMVAGESYTFSARAVNLHPDRSGTGLGPAGVSDEILVTDRAGAPRAFVVKPGDRVLGLSFAPPVSDGGTKVTAYQVSLDRGKSWRKLAVSGTTTLKASIAPVLNGRSYAVAVRAVNANGAGAATGVVTVKPPTWFTDPVSRADRRREIDVPRNPARYRGPLRHTKATFRSKNGTLANPVAGLKGRQLQPGQAVNLGGSSLFGFDSPKLTNAGKAQIRSMASSLRYVRAITCEGYADYGGSVRHELTLSRQRAAAVCAEVQKSAKHVGSRTTKAYGHTWPVVVGGRAVDRSENRRVVVLVQQ